MKRWTLRHVYVSHTTRSTFYWPSTWGETSCRPWRGRSPLRWTCAPCGTFCVSWHSEGTELDVRGRGSRLRVRLRPPSRWRSWPPADEGAEASGTGGWSVPGGSTEPSPQPRIKSTLENSVAANSCALSRQPLIWKFSAVCGTSAYLAFYVTVPGGARVKLHENHERNQAQETVDGEIFREEGLLDDAESMSRNGEVQS